MIIIHTCGHRVGEGTFPKSVGYLCDACKAAKTATIARAPSKKQQERDYDNLYNEGGEGYNPFRNR